MAGTNDEVTVETEELRKTAKFFDGYSNNLLRDIGKLTGLTIEPGTFPAATRLKTKVDACVSALVSNVTALGNAHATIAQNLRTIAGEYDSLEDDNVGEADRITTTIDGVNKDLVSTSKK